MTVFLQKWGQFPVLRMKNGDLIPVIGIRRLRIKTDGQGVRTLIGVAGCPLRCRYCINPHSWNGSISPVYFSPEQLYETVKVDNLYFQATNGGITFGGGEPLLHVERLIKFISLCPQAWSMCAETSLHIPPHLLSLSADYFTHFVIDIKTTDPMLYTEYTSGHFGLVWKNLNRLCSLVDTSNITVRIPMIPGYVDAEKQQHSIAVISSLGITNIDTFSYMPVK